MTHFSETRMQPVASLYALGAGLCGPWAIHRAGDTTTEFPALGLLGNSEAWQAPGTLGPSLFQSLALGFGCEGASSPLAACAKGFRVLPANPYLHSIPLGSVNSDRFFGLKLFGETRASHLVVNELSIFENS